MLSEPGVVYYTLLALSASVSGGLSRFAIRSARLRVRPSISIAAMHGHFGRSEHGNSLSLGT